MDTLSLFEVVPIEYSKTRRVIHTYKKIKIEKLNDKRIEDLYLNCNFKKLPMVVNMKKCFMIVFSPKPPICISKKDGRLYAFQNSGDLAEIQHQASLVLRVLSTFSLVEEHTRKTIRRRREK